jgi:RNA polymerase sigma factor (sigma-70 family)
VPLGASFDQVLWAAKADAGWALTRLYESLAPAVAGYLRRRRVSDPEDLTSEVFLAAFSKLRSFEGDEAQFRSFVFTIAYRRVVDDKRSQARTVATESLETGGVGENKGGRSDPAEDDAFRSLGTELVQSLLDGLPPDQRDVLALRLIADMTVEQVASALGKQPGAVKALQRRALANLRRQLSEQAGVPL